MALELELRRGRGERPTAREYRDRFPGQADVVDAAFGATARAGDEPAAAEPARRTPAATCSSASWPCRTTSSAATTCWPPSPPGSPTSRGPWARSSATAGRSTTPATRCWRRWSPSTSSSTAATPRRAWRRSARSGSVRDDLERLDDADLQASLAATASRAAGADGDAGATATYTSSSRRAGERFRILRFHREGGLGRVYVARDEELGREVALKEIRPDKVAEADLRGRFVLEAEINGGLEHPGIVPVYSLGTYDDGRPFYAMRFVEGDSLKEAIESYHKEHPRPDPTAVEFRKLLGRFIDVCEAIAFAHSKGVLHRDLKPHNVMLGRYGETLLIDWGLAKATGRREPVGPEAAVEATLVPPSGSGHAPTLGVLGSPPYMSPEQAAGAAESLGPATDVYGLGAILFALLTGEPPVEGKTTEEVLDRVRRGAIRSPRSLNPNIPRALEAVCLKALATAAGGPLPDGAGAGRGGRALAGRRAGDGLARGLAATTGAVGGGTIASGCNPARRRYWWCRSSLLPPRWRSMSRGSRRRRCADELTSRGAGPPVAEAGDRGTQAGRFQRRRGAGSCISPTRTWLSPLTTAET